MNLALVIGIVALSVALAADAAAVGLAVALRLETVGARRIFRFSFHFALFQTLLPLLGYLAGETIEPWIVHWDHWLAFAILAGLGTRGIVDAWRGQPVELSPDRDPTRGARLVALSVATSIDALVVGVSIPTMGYPLWQTLASIGLVTALLTALAMSLAGRLGARFGRAAGAVGGLLLAGLGVKIVLDHLGPLG